MLWALPPAMYPQGVPPGLPFVEIFMLGSLVGVVVSYITNAALRGVREGRRITCCAMQHAGRTTSTKAFVVDGQELAPS